MEKQDSEEDVFVAQPEGLNPILTFCSISAAPVLNTILYISCHSTSTFSTIKLRRVHAALFADIGLSFTLLTVHKGRGHEAMP